ncbi:MAG: PilZ domain-containing protein [Geobacter sp.]|nr:PilZ domain-containing protein [Geobacter sp.]
MIEKRRFHRVLFRTKCLVRHDEIPYDGCVENISLKGAMISFDEAVMVPQGDCCSLEISLAGEKAPILISAEIIYSTMFRIGVEFGTFEAGHHFRLCGLMERLTGEPAKLREELKLIGLESD